MKTHLLAGLLIIGTAVAASASASDRKLSANEIADTLSGNTVEGLWGDTPYKSYFDPSGFTLYKAEGRPPDRGKWRVDGEAHRYCSHWEQSGWSCYDLYQDGDKLIWQIPGDTTRYPSKLLEGDQL